MGKEYEKLVLILEALLKNGDRFLSGKIKIKPKGANSLWVRTSGNCCATLSSKKAGKGERRAEHCPITTNENHCFHLFTTQAPWVSVGLGP